jgi:anti-sigma28 factor (negative regulator of flagellin synthesis)
VSRQDRTSQRERDHTGSRKQRVTALRDLIKDRGYDVPAEDVAASIIRDALVVSAPAAGRPD